MEDKIRVLSRAFDILEALSVENRPMTLSEISNASGLSKSTAHRILSAMLDRSFVAKNDNGEYTIGFKIIEIAGTHINNLELLARRSSQFPALYADRAAVSRVLLFNRQVSYVLHVQR